MNVDYFKLSWCKKWGIWPPAPMGASPMCTSWQTFRGYRWPWTTL